MKFNTTHIIVHCGMPILFLDDLAGPHEKGIWYSKHMTYDINQKSPFLPTTIVVEEVMKRQHIIHGKEVNVQRYPVGRGLPEVMYLVITRCDLSETTGP